MRNADSPMGKDTMPQVQQKIIHARLGAIETACPNFVANATARVAPLRARRTIPSENGLTRQTDKAYSSARILVRRGVRTKNMPLPGKVERPQWVTRPRRYQGGI